MLTPEQAQDLVAWAGGQKAAGRAIGVRQSTVWGWLNPVKLREVKRRSYLKHAEKNREYSRRWTAAHPEYKREWVARNRERVRQYHIDWYWNLSGYQYNLLRLRGRRHDALRRMAKRNQGKGGTRNG